MFREQKIFRVDDFPKDNSNREKLSKYWTIAGRRKIIFNDNERLPNIFPRPDEFEKIQRLGGFIMLTPGVVNFGLIPINKTGEKEVFTMKNSRYEKEIGLKMNGRIETYVHSDSTTSSKGAVIVKIVCESDFAAKTQEFIDFCKLTAKLCYACEFNGPILDYVSGIMEIDSEYLSKLEELEKKLKEKIDVVDVCKIVL